MEENIKTIGELEIFIREIYIPFIVTEVMKTENIKEWTNKDILEYSKELYNTIEVKKMDILIRISANDKLN